MRTAIAALLGLFACPAIAALNVFACTPEWASLAQELGGERASIYTASTALQDPHRIEARPSLIARARNADLAVCTGADLEVGWLPLVLTQSANPRIRPGQPGYFEATSVVALLDKPERLDRALGDVHPAGNPHVHLDPRNIAAIAAALGERMAVVDASNAAYYGERTKAFLERWREASARWEKEAQPLRGAPVIVHHKNLTYLLAWLGMREAGSLEPKPGLPPSAAHLNALLEALRRAPARGVLRAAYNDPRPAEWLAGQARIPALVLPYTVGGNERAKDLFSLYEDTLNRLLALVR
jgi:zinc/manganese transport system substrate-binding protein